MNSARKTTMTLFSAILMTGIAIDSKAQTGAQMGAQTGAQASAAKGPSDPEIAHIVVTANKIDIDAGKMAQGKAKSKEVKAFAKQMVTDHTAVNQQASDLAKKLGVTPKDNDVSKSLSSGASETAKKLKGLKGAEFDKAYVDNEVAFHEAVLKAIDETLVPSAKNEELKGLIVKVRPAIQAHLDHAKSIQATLAK